MLDGVGGDIARAAFGLLVPGGRILMYGAASGDWAGITDVEAADRSVTVVAPGAPTPAEQRALTRRALADAAAGRLAPVIGQRFPLEPVPPTRHAAIEVHRRPAEARNGRQRPLGCEVLRGVGAT